MLAAHPDLDLVGGAPDSQSALVGTAEHRPDVVLLDAMMEQGGSELASELRRAAPSARLVVLSGLPECPPALVGLTDAFIAKRRTFGEIADAVRGNEQGH